MRSVRISELTSATEARSKQLHPLSFPRLEVDRAGQCTEVPYAQKIPPKAKIKPWWCASVAGLILVWHQHRRRDTAVGPAGGSEYGHSRLDRLRAPA